MSELELLLVNQARKGNPDLHRRTDGEILQMFKDNQMPDGQTDVNVDDVDMTYAQDDFNVEPQYRIRDQLKRDFLQGGIFKDAYKGLGDTYNQLRQSPLGQGIGSIKNFATNTAGRGINLGRMALSGIGNMIMPGLGFVLSNLPKDSPRNIFNRSFTVGGSNMPNDPYGYYSALRAGNLNQDPFGRNPVSAFGNYKGTLAKDANYLGTNKFNLAKKDFAQNYLDKNAINSGGVKIDNTVYSGADYQGGGGNGGGGGGGAADISDRNRGGYATDDTASFFSKGGIASLQWQR
tara:strand:+ start:45 stop:917 length:873 start_codon:yes stop_codon:yes gene_type:complete